MPTDAVQTAAAPRGTASAGGLLRLHRFIVRLLGPAAWARCATSWSTWRLGVAAVGGATWCAALAVVGALYWAAIGRGVTRPLSLPGLGDLLAVWFEWHADRWLGPAEWILIGSLVASAIGLAGSAWLLLPFVHRGGDPRRSFYRCLSGLVGALLWLATALTVLLLLLSGALYCGFYPWRPWWYWAASPLIVLATLVVVGSVSVLVFERAAYGASDGGFIAELPPRCGGCGYDLSTHSHDERCPECGLPVAVSLAPAQRPGAAFARRPALAGLVRTTADILLRPRRFYSALRLRPSPDEPLDPLAAARRFARRNWMLLWSAAWLWVVLLLATLQEFHGGGEALLLYAGQVLASGLALLAVCLGGALGLPAVAICAVAGMCLWTASQDRPVGSEEAALSLVLPVLAAAAISLCAWGLHRAVAALVFTAWAVRRVLPDFRWAAVAIHYETAFLWWYALLLGMLLASFAVANDWISRTLGRDMFMRALRMPPEPLLVLAILATLTLTWLLRYGRVLRAIRWSNH